MFTIGKLAGLTSVSNDTLRYYEQEGLIRRSLHRRRKIRTLQRGDDRALLHRLFFVCTFCDQLIERLGHGFHRSNFVFDLQFLLDRPRANVAAGGVVASA